MSRSPLAEAHLSSLGRAERRVLGCLRPDRSWRENLEIGREDGRIGRREFLDFSMRSDAPRLRSRLMASNGSNQQNLPILPSSRSSLLISQVLAPRAIRTEAAQDASLGEAADDT